MIDRARGGKCFTRYGKYKQDGSEGLYNEVKLVFTAAESNAISLDFLVVIELNHPVEMGDWDWKEGHSR